MPEQQAARAPLPVVDFLKLPTGGEPYLEGHKCQACGAIFLGARSVCSKCGSRDRLQPQRLANRGTLYAYSIVYRSFPGVQVPYISAIVDLEGGGTVKGNLIGVEPDPAKLSFGMPIDVVFKDALGRKDREGNAYISYFFQPAGAKR
jgi:uncharacterized OB-fold protein